MIDPDSFDWLGRDIETKRRRWTKILVTITLLFTLVAIGLILAL